MVLSTMTLTKKAEIAHASDAVENRDLIQSIQRWDQW